MGLEIKDLAADTTLRLVTTCHRLRCPYQDNVNQRLMIMVECACGALAMAILHRVHPRNGLAPPGSWPRL